MMLLLRPRQAQAGLKNLLHATPIAQTPQGAQAAPAQPPVTLTQSHDACKSRRHNQRSNGQNVARMVR